MRSFTTSPSRGVIRARRSPTNLPTLQGRLPKLTLARAAAPRSRNSGLYKLSNHCSSQAPRGQVPRCLRLRIHAWSVLHGITEDGRRGSLRGPNPLLSMSGGKVEDHWHSECPPARPVRVQIWICTLSSLASWTRVHMCLISEHNMAIVWLITGPARAMHRGNVRCFEVAVLCDFIERGICWLGKSGIVAKKMVHPFGLRCSLGLAWQRIVVAF